MFLQEEQEYEIVTSPTVRLSDSRRRNATGLIDLDCTRSANSIDFEQHMGDQLILRPRCCVILGQSDCCSVIKLGQKQPAVEFCLIRGSDLWKEFLI